MSGKYCGSSVLLHWNPSWRYYILKIWDLNDTMYVHKVRRLWSASAVLLVVLCFYLAVSPQDNSLCLMSKQNQNGWTANMKAGIEDHFFFANQTFLLHTRTRATRAHSASLLSIMNVFFNHILKRTSHVVCSPKATAKISIKHSASQSDRKGKKKMWEKMKHHLYDSNYCKLLPKYSLYYSPLDTANEVKNL